VSILIESVNENPAFAEFVQRELLVLNPAALGKIRVVASLEVASALERTRYVHGQELDWDLSRR
jgi:hypothetical protein